MVEEETTGSSGRCIANCLLKRHPEPEKRSHKDEHSQKLFASKRSTCAQIGLYSGEYGGRKIKVCEYFLARFCKTSFL